MNAELFGLVVAASVTAVVTPLLRRLALRHGIVDRPGPLKTHAEPIPTLGGFGVVIGVLGGLVALHVSGGGLPSGHVLGFAAAAVPVAAVSLYDDVRGCGVWLRLAAHAAAGAILYGVGLRVVAVTNPFGGPVELGVLAPLVTALWIVTAINAVNLIDGLDGLAAGTAAIAGLSLAVVGIRRGEAEVAALGFVLVGAAAAFLPYNYPRATIYLGDVGSTFLGLCLGTVALLENHKATTALTLLVPIVALGVPVLDTTIAVARRTAAGRSPLSGDLGHLHHRLVALGLPPPMATAFLLIVTGGLGALAVGLVDASKEFALAVVIGLTTAVAASLALLGRAERRGRPPAAVPIQVPR